MEMERIYKSSIYYWPRDEKWFDNYENGCYDLIVLDEYRAQKKITQLNPILSGDPVQLSRRCTSPLVYRDNLPVIILSNFHPRDAYRLVEDHALAPLLDRLEIITFEQDQPIRLDYDVTIPDTVPIPSSSSLSQPSPSSVVFPSPSQSPSSFSESPDSYSFFDDIDNIILSQYSDESQN